MKQIIRLFKGKDVGLYPDLNLVGVPEPPKNRSERRAELKYQSKKNKVRK